MATTKKRISISLSKAMERSLKGIALRDQTTQATKAMQLLAFAIELEEDRVFADIARGRDTASSRFFPLDAWR